MSEYEKAMTVGDLKKMLDKYPDDMEILNERMSDYSIVTECEWGIVKAVPKNDYVMRSHPTMSDENKRLEKEYLHLDGN